jgi:hypothetical protein
MKYANKLVIFFLLVCHFPYAYFYSYAGSNADYPEINAVIKPAKTTIGVPVEYRIEISGKNLKGINITLPEQKEYYPKEKPVKKPDKEKKSSTADKLPLYIIQSARKDEKTGSGISRLSVILTLSYYRTGQYKAPEIEISGQDKIKIGYNIPEVEILPVNSKGDFQEIEAPLDLGGNYTRMIIIIALLAVLAAAAWFILRYIRLRKEQNAVTIPETPPLEIFMKEVLRLKTRRLIENGKYEEFVIGISSIFRKFISSSFKIDAMEMTTSEILKMLNDQMPRSIYSGIFEDMQGVLNLWDLSKFAEFVPSAEVFNENLESSIKLAKKLHREKSGVRN